MDTRFGSVMLRKNLEFVYEVEADRGCIPPYSHFVIGSVNYRELRPEVPEGNGTHAWIQNHLQPVVSFLEKERAQFEKDCERWDNFLFLKNI